MLLRGAAPALVGCLVALLASPAAALLPHDLSNFQGKWPCTSEVLMGKPKVRAETDLRGQPRQKPEASAPCSRRWATSR